MKLIVAPSAVTEPDAKWQALELRGDDQHPTQSLTQWKRGHTPAKVARGGACFCVSICCCGAVAEDGIVARENSGVAARDVQSLEAGLRKALLQGLPSKAEREDIQRRFEVEEASPARSHDWKDGARIGEADDPGPAKKASKRQRGNINQNTQHTTRMKSAPWANPPKEKSCSASQRSFRDVHGCVDVPARQTSIPCAGQTISPAPKVSGAFILKESKSKSRSKSSLPWTPRCKSTKREAKMLVR